MRRSSATAATVALAATFFFVPGLVSAAERITAFSSHIELHTDGSASVQEEIVFDFGDVPQHGIYREIPLVLPAEDLYGETQAEISSITVTDGKGTPRQASYDKGGNMVTLKIGDYDKLVSGAQLYVIRYTLWGAFTPTLLHDRFLWDVTGHEWKVPIERVRADVILPSPLSEGAFTFTCISGDRESATPCSSLRIQEFATSGMAHVVRFEEGGLGRMQGMFVRVELPKGVILYERQDPVPASSPARSLSFVRWWTRPFLDISLAFPFFIFAGLYSIYLSSRGKEKKRPSGKHADSFHQFSLRTTYLLAGVHLVLFAFVVPMWNFGILTSGLVVFGFAWLYPRS